MFDRMNEGMPDPFAPPMTPGEHAERKQAKIEDETDEKIAGGDALAEQFLKEGRKHPEKVFKRLEPPEEIGSETKKAA